MNGFVTRAVLHSAGIVTAFLLCAAAALLMSATGYSTVQPLLLVLLAGSAAALAHACGQPLNATLLMTLSALPFAAWLGLAGWREGFAVLALLTAAALVAAPGAGAVIAHRFRHGRLWRRGHSATALLTIALLLLIILAPLLLTMPR